MASFLDQVLPTIGALAPTAASALGGPLAGLAVSAIESALGFDPGTAQTKDGQSAILQKIGSLDPQTAAAMRKADQDFQAKLKELDIDLAKINEQDTESARTMQVQTKDITPRLLGMVIVGGFFALLSVLAFRNLPTANHDILISLISYLGGSVTAIIHFYFGSSAGSQNKDATIQMQAAKK